MSTSYPNDSNLRTEAHVTQFSSDNARANYSLNSNGNNDYIFPMSTTSEMSAIIHQVNDNNEVREDGNKTLFVLGEKTNNDVNIPKIDISSQNLYSKKRKIGKKRWYMNIFNFFTELRIQIKL